MLYVGLNELFSGYVRVEARPPTEVESKSLFHKITAFPSISIPRRPARPVSCVYSPGEIATCPSPFHLLNFSSTTVRAGILIPSAKVSVAKTALTSPLWNNSSTVTLNAGNKPAW